MEAAREGDWEGPRTRSPQSKLGTIWQESGGNKRGSTQEKNPKLGAKGLAFRGSKTLKTERFLRGFEEEEVEEIIAQMRGQGEGYVDVLRGEEGRDSAQK